MASKIVPLIPPHTVYVEPFAGGAAVFYAKQNPSGNNGDSYREVLNDISGDLVSMYQVAKKNPNGFACSVKAIPFSAAILEASKDRSGCSYCRAQKKYIRHNQSFAYFDGDSFARSSFRANVAAIWKRRLPTVQSAAERLSDVFLDSIDAVQCIGAWDSPHTFFYVDPPYLGTDSFGLGKWDLENAFALVDALNKAKGSWIVSGYNELRGLLGFKKMLSFQTSCTASGEGRVGQGRNHGEPKCNTFDARTERLFMRGPTHPVRSSLIPVLEKQTCFTGPLLGPCPLPLKTHPSARK